MNIYAQLAEKIIQEQENIIGPVALEQARKVEGLEVTSDKDIKILGNEKDVLQKLVTQYAKLFGQASIEVCKEAVHEVKTALSPNDLPEILR